jgi:hypothetical protein
MNGKMTGVRSLAHSTSFNHVIRLWCKGSLTPLKIRSVSTVKTLCSSSPSLPRWFGRSEEVPCSHYVSSQSREKHSLSNFVKYCVIQSGFPR